MGRVVLSCSSLVDFVKTAQERAGTDYPVHVVDRQYHAEPEQMKRVVGACIRNLPEDADTVLVAMGFCGGVWDHVTFDRRIVIPRVDDCVTLLLHTDDNYHSNLKEPGCLYIYENDPEDFSALTLLRDDAAAEKEYAGISREMLYHFWFGQYHTMNIIDTGLNDCYSVEYVQAAQDYADRINASLGYTGGSILLLEKLVAGRWDRQFLVAEPGHLILHGDFFGDTD